MTTTLYSLLTSRQDALDELVQKGEFAQKTRFARDFAIVNKSSPLALYADSTAKVDSVSEKDGISWWTVSTPALDREGDVLDPLGCLEELEPFRLNPIVDFDHRKYYPLPIGKSVGDGYNPLIITDKGIKAGCKHHSESVFSDEVARLVFKGFLNAASIAFMPVVGERLNKAYGGDKAKCTPRYRFRRWQPTAWSVAPVGVNGEAIRCELSRGIKSMELRKSLEPFAETPAIWSPGYSFSQEEEAMVDFDTIDKESVGAIRFHKSKYPDDAACQAWLFEKGLDGSVVSTHEKSLDFVQSPGELDEKTVKVADGIYAVYLKGFPIKKKKKPGETPPTDGDPKAKKPPFPAKPGAAKPKPGEKPSGDAPPPKAKAKKQIGDEFDDANEDEMDDDLEEGGSGLDDEAAPGEEDEGGSGDEADNPFAEDDEEILDPNADPEADPSQLPGEGQDGTTPPGPQADVGMDQSGTPTYAGQALIDVAKHMAAELRYYTQSMEAHDHDGLKALMMQAMKNCQRDYEQWMAGAKRLFPHMDFDSMSELGDDMNKGDDPLNESVGSEGGNLVDDQNKKLIKSLSEDDWEEIAAVACVLID